MRVPVPVTRSNDLSAGYSTHLFLAVPPAPPPTVNAAIEIPIPHAWPPGESAGKVQKTTTVFVNGKNVMLDLHDCGPVIPQITIPPVNALIPTQLFKSKRAVTVTCFSVRMNGKTTACTGLWPPLALLACGEPVSWPTTFTFTNVCVNVHVGVSGADLIGGLLLTLATMAIDRCFFRLPDVKLKPWEELAKGFLGAAASAAASFVQHMIDPRYPIRVDTKVKAPGGIEIKIIASTLSTDTINNPQKISISIEKKVEDKYKSHAASIGGSGEYTWDAGGDTTKEGFKGQIGAAGAAPGLGIKGTAAGEHHPDASEEQRTKWTLKKEEATPFGSEAMQHDYNPGAPEGQGWSSKTERVVKGQSGDRRTTTVANPDGTTTVTVVENKDGRVTMKTRKHPGVSGQIPEQTGSGDGPPRAADTVGSNVWGPPL
ncbi:hypothetical protein [Sorangium sp. So ce388]|uniref:hypothetical protein n=1 Tax=Sorangium sp. So ce388 TaxID=3133309 RepID=UPI003F5C83A7